MTSTLAAPRREMSVLGPVGDGLPPDCDSEWEQFFGLFDPEFDDPPPPPPWVLQACAERDRDRLRRAATKPVDGESLTALAGFDPSTLDADALLDAIAASQRLINHAQALQQRYLAALARPGVATPLASLVDSALHPTGRQGEPALGVVGALPGDLPVTEAGDIDYAPLLDRPAWRDAITDQACRFAASEISCLLRLTPITARLRVENAMVMVDQLPETLAAQQRGDLDGYRASIIADRTRVLAPGLCGIVERTIVTFATRHTSGELRRAVDRAVIAADTTAAERRAIFAKARRGVTVDPAEDGMATLRLFATAANTALVHGVLDTIATSVRAAGYADGRGASQLRADAMVDLFHALNRTGHARIGIPADADDQHVNVTGDAKGIGGRPLVTGILPMAAAIACGCSSAGAGDGPLAAGGTVADPCAVAGSFALADSHALADSCGAADFCTAADAAAVASATAGSCTVAGSCTTGDSRTTAAARRASAAARTGETVRHGVTLNVYLDVATLAGLDDQPGELAGFGAITADTARALARSADRIRAIIARPARPDRACGTVLDAGRTVYRPPAAVADYVIARDRTCQFPGCRAPATRCDLDHRRAFEDGGDTCPHNLNLLCRTHHRLKTFTRWRAEPAADGVLTWTSPLGRRYPTESAHLLRGSPPVSGSPGAAAPAADDPPPF